MELISSLLAYVHDLDSTIIKFNEVFAIRWYGLAYILGFFLGYLLLKNLCKRKLWNLPEEKLTDFVTYVAIFGILLGARLGYVFFYMARNHGWDAIWDDPFAIIRVWEGGMASHGGLIGVIVFVLIYARMNKLSALGLLDGLAIVAPVGIFCGRMANFINGELYGRVTEGVAWAMKFPTELYGNAFLRQSAALRLHSLGSPLVPQYPEVVSEHFINDVMRANREGDPLVKETLESILPDRHPSQLYEAFAEGIVIFGILYLIRVKFPQAKEGLFSGLFCILYAMGRITVEYFREPDSAMVGIFTMGQFLSLFMIIIGVGLLIYSWKSKSPIPVSSTEAEKK